MPVGKKRSAAASSMDLFGGSNWYDRLTLVGTNKLLVPSVRAGKSDAFALGNPKNIDVQKSCFEQLLSLARLHSCDFSSLRLCMAELSGSTVLVGLNALIVRGKLEHLLCIEMKLLRTPNISELDRASIHAACAHVAATFYSNVLHNAGVRVDQTNVTRRVELGGTSYKLAGVHICNLLWHGAVALRYTYAGSAEPMNVAGVHAHTHPKPTLPR